MDKAFQLLLPHIEETTSNSLLVADENLLGALTQFSLHKHLKVLTNRFDVAQACKGNLECNFSDYDFSPFANNSLTTVYYRISKEKPVVHHIINQAQRTLKTGGILFLCGEKNEGIKSFTDKAAALFSDKTRPVKSGNVYLAKITKRNDTITTPLDDKDYPKLRPIKDFLNLPLFSKPGVFGWDKHDFGSALLIKTAEQHLTEAQPQSVLDLGCGYGYLILATQTWPTLIKRTATDNNATAILCCRHNCLQRNLDVEVIADDCASSIVGKFDLILCNPPFHQGFDVDSGLTHKFIAQTKRLLAPDGEALFVVNQFIGLKSIAAKHQLKACELVTDSGFTVFSLTH